MLAEPLPSYETPPVVEVAVGVHFEPIPRLSSVQLAVLWQNYRNEFPDVEEHPPLAPTPDPTAGDGDGPQIRIELLEEPGPPRLWFLTSDKTELIQVQPDRFVHNWRQITPGAEYPRYVHVRERIETELGIFEEFLRNEELGAFVPRLCEVTYVNRVVSGEGWKRHGELDQILSVWSGRHSDGFLPEPIDIQARIRYPVQSDGSDPGGVLTAVLQPGRVAREPVYQLTMSALIKTPGDQLPDVLNGLDTGHEWVVRGFTSITTTRMHDVWRREDGASA